jgi:hypothetical protein
MQGELVEEDIPDAVDVFSVYSTTVHVHAHIANVTTRN